MKGNLFLRVISALVLAPVVLAAILYKEGDASVTFSLLVAVMGALMSWEWEKMISSKTSAVAVTLAMMSSSVAFLMTEFDPLWALGVVAFTALFIYFKFGRHILLSFGAFYIGLPILSMVYIAYYSGYDDLSYSYTYILWLIFVVWATDIGGYIFGKSIGGPKLVPTISPKKTWAGLLGGMAFSALVTYVFVLTMNHYYDSQLNMLFFVLSSTLLAVISQVGDIFESSIKRRMNLKDSSQLIPGHGGIFDRVDGLLFASVALAIYILVVNNWHVEG